MFCILLGLRQEEVMDELLQRLDAMGIDSLGALEKFPSLVEQRTWGLSL
jgi:hypothetical protein